MIEIKFEKEQNKSIVYDGNNQIGECSFIEHGEEWNIVHTEVSNLYQGQKISGKRYRKCIKKW